MTKLNLIWILAVFLLAVPMAFAVPDFYVLIEADNITGGWNINSNTLTQLESNLWILYAQQSDTYEVQRAKVYKTLFYGTDGTNPRANSTYIENISAIYTNELRDIGKRGHFTYLNYGDGYGADKSGVGKWTGTFDDTSNNNNVSSWSYLDYWGDGSYCLFYAKWEIPSGATKNSIGSNDDISDETGTDTSSEQEINPTNSRLVVSYCADNNDNNGATTTSFLLAKGNMSWAFTYTGNLADSRTYYATDFYINHSVPEFLGDTFVINSLDNYTQYGYNQTDITNFTAQITNGTDKFTKTANITDFVVFTGLTGLWNITLSHPEYSNRNYYNHNVSTDLTGYMYQTHLHSITDCEECVTSNTYIAEDSPTTPQGDDILTYERGGSYLDQTKRSYVGYNAPENMSAIIEGNLYLYRYYTYIGSSGAVHFYENTYSKWANVTGTTWDNPPVLENLIESKYTYMYSGNPPANAWNSYNISGGTYGGLWYSYASLTDSYTTSNFIDTHYRAIGDANPPYINATMSSNFTIAVFDGFSGEAINNITINVSKWDGGWYKFDNLTGTNTITYAFDEGTYDITITTESGLTTTTFSNYNLSTQANYLSAQIDSNEYAVFNLTVYDEETEQIIDENITINAIGNSYSEEVTRSNGIWYDTSENFKPEEYWFSAQGTSGTNGSDWDIRTYFVNFIPVGTGMNTFYMYLLNNTKTSQICINVYDESGSAMEGAYIELLRHYPANNTYKTVQIGKTDAQGQVNLIAIPDTVVYKYTIHTSLGGSAQYTSSPSYLSDASCYTIYLTESETVGLEWFQSGQVSYSFYYDEPTTTMNYLWDDSNNLVAKGCLKTMKTGIFSTLIDYTCQSSASGQLYHTIDNTTEATYLSYGYVYMSSDPTYEIFVGTFGQEIDLNTSEVIGKLGLFLVLLVILVMTFAGIWNGGVAIMLSGVTILLAQATGIIMMNIVWTIGIILMGVIVMVLNRD